MTESISRRLMLELGLSAGVALAASRTAWAAAPQTRIEKMAPELDAIIATDQPVRILATGYGGDAGQAEGPVWWREQDGGGYLLFSDIDHNQRIKYMPGQGVSVFKKGTNHGNGLTRDQKGRLVVCEAETRRVVRIEDDGSTTVICNSFGGKRLNRPNDVVVRSDGAIYFNAWPIVPLDAQQEALVTRVAQHTFRPCCNNSTFFQDCNHGSALLGLLALGASQGLTEDELYREALAFNAFWFPEHYTHIALYFKVVKGIDWRSVDARAALSANFSSANGIQANVSRELRKRGLVPAQNGTQCSA